MAARFRDQARNREDARARLADLIARALTRPKPRIATRPTRTGVEKRLVAKAKRGALKSQRRNRPGDD